MVQLTPGRERSSSVVIRERKGGMIIDAAPVFAFRLYGADETEFERVEILADGTEVIRTSLVVSNLPKGVDIAMNVIVGGVTFGDGKLSKRFLPTDFNAIGEKTVYFFMHEGLPTSACHEILAFDRGNMIGRKR